MATGFPTLQTPKWAYQCKFECKQRLRAVGEAVAGETARRQQQTQRQNNQHHKDIFFITEKIKSR
jgi:hypothetical protein